MNIEKKGKISLMVVIIMLLQMLVQLVPTYSKAVTTTNDVIVNMATTSTQVIAGDTIYVDVIATLKSGINIDTFDVTITYDSTVLQCDPDNIESNTTTKWNSPDFNNDVSGEIMLSTTRSAANSGKSGTVLRIPFKVLKTATMTKLTTENEINSAYLGEDLWSAGTSLTIGSVSYTVTYNPNITGGVPTTATKAEDVAHIITAGPNRTGYIFTGWNTQADGTGTSYAVGDSYTTNANLTLYAQWRIQQYTVTVNPNGGTWSDGTATAKTYTQNYGTTVTIPTPANTPAGYKVQFNANGGTTSVTEIAQTTTFNNWSVSGSGNLNGSTYTFGAGNGTITANYKNNGITLPTANRVGYSFTGWYTPSGTKAGDANAAYTATTNISLDAKWQGNTYTVTYYAPDTTLHNTTKTITYGSPYGTLAAPTKPGYTFDHWINEDGVTITSSTIVNTLSDITLSAVWVGKTNTLTVNPNGGSWKGSTNPQNIAIRTGETTTIDNPVAPNGYTVTLSNKFGTTQTLVQNRTFTNWKVTAGDGTISSDQYTAGVNSGTIQAQYTTDESVVLPTGLVQDGYVFDGWYTSNGSKVSNTYVPTSNVTLTAKWIGNNYTLTLNPDGGSVTNTSIQITNGTAFGTLPTPIKTGYNFDGWYDDTTGNKITSTSIVNTTSNMTATAKWVGAPVTVTFNPDGGTVNPTTKTVYKEGTYGTLPTPTKVGYAFTGWYDADDNKIETTTVVTKVTPHELTAKWEAKQYTVNFYDEDGTTLLGTDTVSHGTAATAPANPSKPSDLQYSYTFKGWDKDFSNVIGDMSIKAVYETVAKKYTVTFYDEDGSTILGTSVVEYGKPAVAPATPTKQRNDGYTYTFAGWDKEFNNVTIDMGVKASYSRKANEYTITYKNLMDSSNSENPSTYTVEDGMIEIKPLADKQVYKFNGWYEDAAATGDKVEKIDSNRKENITLYANWILDIPQNVIYYVKDSAQIDNANAKIYTDFDDAKMYVDGLYANGTTQKIYDINNDLVYDPSKKTTEPGEGTGNHHPDVEYYVKKAVTDETTKSNTFYSFADAAIYAYINKEEGMKVFDMQGSILYVPAMIEKLYLKSEKYEIGKNNLDEYDEYDVYINRINADTTLKQFKNNCNTNGKITVYNAEGTIISDNDLVGTEMIMKVEKDNESIFLVIVVTGDLDGNGKLTVTDLSVMNKQMVEQINLSGAKFMAADMDNNKVVTVTDLSKMNQVIVENV